MLRLQPLPQRAQHLLARGQLVVQHVLEALAGPVQAQLAVANQAAGIATRPRSLSSWRAACARAARGWRGRGGALRWASSADSSSLTRANQLGRRGRVGARTSAQ